MTFIHSTKDPLYKSYPFHWYTLRYNSISSHDITFRETNCARSAEWSYSNCFDV